MQVSEINFISYIHSNDLQQARDKRTRDIKFLMDYNERKTPLLFAVSSNIDNRLLLITKLIAAGTNPYIREANGNNAFDYSREQPDVLTILNQTRQHKK